MNDIEGLHEMSDEELEALNIQLGNQIAHIKDKRRQINARLNERAAAARAQHKAGRMSPAERQALKQVLAEESQQVKVKLQPGVVGAEGQQGA